MYSPEFPEEGVVEVVRLQVGEDFDRRVQITASLYIHKSGSTSTCTTYLKATDRTVDARRKQLTDEGKLPTKSKWTMYADGERETFLLGVHVCAQDRLLPGGAG